MSNIIYLISAILFAFAVSTPYPPDCVDHLIESLKLVAERAQKLQKTYESFKHGAEELEKRDDSAYIVEVAKTFEKAMTTNSHIIKTIETGVEDLHKLRELPNLNLIEKSIEAFKEVVDQASPEVEKLTEVLDQLQQALHVALQRSDWTNILPESPRLTNAVNKVVDIYQGYVERVDETLKEVKAILSTDKGLDDESAQEFNAALGKITLPYVDSLKVAVAELEDALKFTNEKFN